MPYLQIKLTVDSVLDDDHRDVVLVTTRRRHRCQLSCRKRAVRVNESAIPSMDASIPPGDALKLICYVHVPFCLIYAGNRGLRSRCKRREARVRLSRG